MHSIELVKHVAFFVASRKNQKSLNTISLPEENLSSIVCFNLELHVQARFWWFSREVTC